MAFGSGAGEMLLKLSSELGKGLGKKATGKVSTQALQTLNRRLGRTIITKYGTKRGVVALGTAFPFGIGAAIGAGGNYAMVRTVGRHADKLFRSLPPGSLESTDLSRSND
jgi:hypothetical protein